MDLLQYSFTLGADHSMDAVRERVAAKRHLLDGLPGLRWKAWLLSEPLPGRPQAKSYAPLYLFDDTPSALAFLGGALYRGVTDAFGWTLPRHGPLVGALHGTPAGARSCTLHTLQLEDHAALHAALAPAKPPADTLLVACQLDVSQMRLRRYRFRAAAPAAVDDAAADCVYEVVALSPPAPAA